MKALHLNLRAKPFDMILTGFKKEEYRNVTPYWISRLVRRIDVFGTQHTFKNFDKIIFKNGYSKQARTMVIEFKGLGIGTPIKKYCDGKFKADHCFVIHLGKIISTSNL